MQLIEQQTAGQFSAASFRPASAQTPYCAFHARFWLQPGGGVIPTARPANLACCRPARNEEFPAQQKQAFCISAMAFQDAWNVDLERLRECFIHVVGAHQGIVPFCAYNMTNMLGDSLYRGK